MKNYENFLNESVSKLFDTLHNRKDAIKGLLSTGFDINTIDEDGSSLLIRICEWGIELDILEILLNTKGIDINIINKKGNSVLLNCLINYEDKAISLLLEQPELDLSITYRSMGNGGNMMSTYANDQNVKKMLINFKPELNNHFFERLSPAAIEKLEPIFLEKYSEDYERYLISLKIDEYDV